MTKVSICQAVIANRPESLMCFVVGNMMTSSVLSLYQSYAGVIPYRWWREVRRYST